MIDAPHMTARAARAADDARPRAPTRSDGAQMQEFRSLVTPAREVRQGETSSAGDGGATPLADSANADASPAAQGPGSGARDPSETGERDRPSDRSSGPASSGAPRDVAGAKRVPGAPGNAFPVSDASGLPAEAAVAPNPGDHATMLDGSASARSTTMPASAPDESGGAEPFASNMARRMAAGPGTAGGTMQPPADGRGSAQARATRGTGGPQERGSAPGGSFGVREATGAPPAAPLSGAVPGADEGVDGALRGPDKSGMPAARGPEAPPPAAELARSGQGGAATLGASGATGRANEVVAPSRDKADGAMQGDQGTAREPGGQSTPPRAVAGDRDMWLGIAQIRPGPSAGAAASALQTGGSAANDAWASESLARLGDATPVYRAATTEASPRAGMEMRAGMTGAFASAGAAGASVSAANAGGGLRALWAETAASSAMAEVDADHGDPRSGSLGALLPAGSSGPGAPPTGPGGAAGGGHASVLAQQVGQQLGEMMRAGTGGGRLDITLQPEDLGRLRLVFTPTETGLTVTVSAERPETLDLLRRNIDLLAGDLASQGYTDVAFDFGAAADDGPDAGDAEDTPSSPRAPDAIRGDPRPNGATLAAAVGGTVGLDVRL